MVVECLVGIRIAKVTHLVKHVVFEKGPQTARTGEDHAIEMDYWKMYGLLNVKIADGTFLYK